ncbi:MAG: hypothetical protein R3E91_00740 [Chlamydiales bacterium]
MITNPPSTLDHLTAFFKWKKIKSPEGSDNYTLEARKTNRVAKIVFSIPFSGCLTGFGVMALFIGVEGILHLSGARFSIFRPMYFKSPFAIPLGCTIGCLVGGGIVTLAFTIMMKIKLRDISAYKKASNS